MHTIPDTEQLLTRKQLAGRWSLHVETIKRRERRGELHPVKLGPRQTRIRLSEVLAIEKDAEVSQ